MAYNEDEFMESLDKKWNDERVERFRHKMEHKLNAKEQYYGSRSRRH